MKKTGLLVLAFSAALGAASLAQTGPAPGTFRLADRVPDDVFFFVAQRPDPDRQFLDDHWNKVLDALRSSGVYEEALGLVGAIAGSEHVAEAEKLRQRATQLISSIDWKTLRGQEFVFIQRLQAMTKPDYSMPDMLWLFRSTPELAAKSRDQLLATLEALCQDLNSLAGHPILQIQKKSRAGIAFTQVNLLGSVPGAPPLHVSLAQHGDVVLIAMRDSLRNDVMELMAGEGHKSPLSSSERFRSALSALPENGTTLTFFDMQALMMPIQTSIKWGMDMAHTTKERYRNSGMSEEANTLNNRALFEYQNGRVGNALDLIKEAYKLAPKNSIVLYNLACFNALSGNREEALSWLEKAVEGGFHAPRKIASDSDLISLHDEARYQAALARAAELAAEFDAVDVVRNSSKKGEAHSLRMQAWHEHEQGRHAQGLKLVEQAQVVAPTDSRVLYDLACFHALLGHQSTAFDFLDRSVEGGFYCPNHISRDSDLESLHGHERFEAAVSRARKLSRVHSGRQGDANLALARRLLDRVTGAIGVIDYSASAEVTDGHSIRTESVTRLVPGAEKTPIYPVFGRRQRDGDFARYLPEETLSFSVTAGLDPAALYRFMEDSFRDAGPLGDQVLSVWESIQEEIGVDFEKDVFSWLEGSSVSATLGDGGGSVWLIRVKDEATARKKFAAANEFMATEFSRLLLEATSKNRALAPLGMFAIRTQPLDHDELEGFVKVSMGMSPQPLICGVESGHLIAGTSPDAVALCLATARGEHPSLRKNVRAMAELIEPQGGFTQVALTDRRGLSQELSTGAGMVAMMSGMAGAAIPSPEARRTIATMGAILGKLGPVLQKIDFYKSEASCTTFDGQQWTRRGVTHYVAPEEPKKAEY